LKLLSKLHFLSLKVWRLFNINFMFIQIVGICYISLQTVTSKKTMKNVVLISLKFLLWLLSRHQTYGYECMTFSFFGGRNWSIQRKPLQETDIHYHIWHEILNLSINIPCWSWNKNTMKWFIYFNMLSIFITRILMKLKQHFSLSFYVCQFPAVVSSGYSSFFRQKN
jgi:hypothetical protein